MPRAAFVALFLLLASLANAESVGVIVLAADPKLEPLAGRVRTAVEQQVGQTRDVEQWRELVGSHGPSVRAEGMMRQQTQQTLALLKSGDVSQAPLKELQAAMKAAAATASTSDEQAAFVALAACAWMRGDLQLAEQRLKDAFSFQTTPKAVEVLEPPRWSEAWQRAQFAANDQAHGTLLARSEPAGARVLVDGIARGTTPLDVRDLPQGPHLLQLDLFGYELRGQLVTLNGPSSEQTFKLAPEERTDEHEFRQAVIAAALSDNGEQLAEMLHPFGLDLMVVGWITHRVKGGNIIAVAAVRARDSKVIGSHKLPIEGLEEVQITKLAAAQAALVVEGKSGAVKVEAAKHNDSKDPLDHVDGRKIGEAPAALIQAFR